MSTIDPRAAAGDDEAQLESELVGRAERYGMRTDATDWTKVAPSVARSQKAVSALAHAVDDQPLRATPPSDE
jgi:hypothetical protein